MLCTCQIELFVEPAILKAKYLIYVPKYGFEKEAFKNPHASKKICFETFELSITTFWFCFILLKIFTALRKKRKIKDLYLESSA